MISFVFISMCLVKRKIDTTKTLCAVLFINVEVIALKKDLSEYMGKIGVMYVWVRGERLNYKVPENYLK